MKKCNKCDKDFDDGINFCPVCGTKLEEITSEQAFVQGFSETDVFESEEGNSEKTQTESAIYCPECGQKIWDPNINFCSECGAPINLQQEQMPKVCPKCDGPISNPNAKVCEFCGADLTKPITQHTSVSDFAKKIGDNEFVKSVKSDVQKSESLKFIKDKAKGGNIYLKKQMRTAMAIIAVFVLIVVVATHIHKCEECDKIYFGNKNTINFWGETEDVCKDCYKDFYSWDM